MNLPCCGRKLPDIWKQLSLISCSQCKKNYRVYPPDELELQVDTEDLFQQDTGYQHSIWNGGESFQDPDGQYIQETDYQWEWIRWLEAKIK